MTADNKLVHILKLLDDESAKVRDHVWEVLQANVTAWEPELRARLGQLSAATRKKILSLLDDRVRVGFRTTWGRWREIENDCEKLEAALSGLSQFLSGNKDVTGEIRHPELGLFLDRLAKEFRDTGAALRPSALAQFLFVAKGLRGADADYYDPRNSDLVHVIGQGKGIPISLACVFILVGRRLDLDISGCDVPEHFLTRAVENGQDVIIDCYDGGKVLDKEKLAQLERKYAPDFGRLLRLPATPEAIVARVLRNLINAYHLAGDKPKSEFMWTLAEDLRGDGEDADLLA